MKAQPLKSQQVKPQQIRILVGIMLLLSIPYFLPAFLRMNEGRELSGSTYEQVKKSALKVRRSMSSDDRTLFDTAFGVLEKIKSTEGPNAFANAVDGLDSDQVIELARKTVNERIAAGSDEFKPYHSWDEMISKEFSDPAKKANGQTPLRNSERAGRPY